MPALTGEPWRGLAKVQIRDVAGLGRYFTVSVVDVNPVTAAGDQSTWDFSGDTVAVTLRAEWDQDVATTLVVADTMTIQVRNPGSGGPVGSTWTVSVGTGAGSATRTLHFDSNPLDQSLDVAANRRWGLLEIYLQVVANPGGSSNDYTIDTRGVVFGPVGSTSSWAAGYIRQNPTLLSHSISNVAIGGAEPSIFAYPDAVHVRATPTTAPFLSTSIGNPTFILRRPQSQGGAVERQEIGVFTPLVHLDTDATGFADTDSNPLDNAIGIGMFLGSEAKDLDIVLPTAITFGGDNYCAWAPSGHPAGFSVPDADRLTLRHVGRITVDPRITFLHLFQINDPNYGTPPSSKNLTPAVRTATDFGFISARAINARGEGLNGLTWTTKMWDDDELSGSEATPVVDHSTVSATRGGEAGWAEELTIWNENGPGGLWQKKVVITAPGNATTLEVDHTTILTLVASDPRVVLNLAAGDPATPGTHWRAGQQLVIGARLFQEFIPVSTDAGSGLVSILRFNAATGRLQYLASISPAVWTNIANGVSITTYAMSASPGDADIQIKVFTAEQTTDFGTNDLFIIAQLKRTAAPYQAFQVLDSVGSFARHDAVPAAGTIPELSILFDGSTGHDHVGGTSGRAIGDRS